METNVKVWIAEDDVDEREQILEAVHDAECPVGTECFYTGAQLMGNIEELKEGEQPALVVIGEEVAGMSATQLAIAVRSNIFMHNVPLVIIAERFCEEDMQQLGALQNVHFLRRPYEFEELCEITQRYSDLWRGQQQQVR